MAVLNVNIPHFYCLLRKEHLYGGLDHAGEFEKVCIFAAQSNSGKALLFNAMLDNGTIRSRVPVHMLCSSESSTKMPLDFLQLWDCYSENICVIEYDYLSEMRCKVVFKDGSSCWGSYVMTFDWFKNPFSDEPTQYKCLHMISLDNGCYALQPNNRIYWRDMSFTTKPFPEKPDYKVDSESFKCESVSDRWVISGDDSSYYYSIVKAEGVNDSTAE
jgi:hypothetical protein